MEKIRRWNRRWLISLNAAFVLLATGIWWVTSQSPMARLRASGAPMTYEDLIPEAIPDEENIAAGMRDLLPVLEKQPFEVGEFICQHESNPIEEAELERARRLLAPHQGVVESLVEAINRPRYSSLLLRNASSAEVAWLPAVSAHRAAALLLSLHSRTLLAEGKPNEAAGTVLASLRLGRQLESEPMLVSHFVGIAIQTIAMDDASLLIEDSSLSPEMTDRLVQSIALIEDRSSAVWALTSERVIFLEECSLPGRLLVTSKVLKSYEQAIEALATPLDQLVATGQALADQTNKEATSDIGKLHIPSIDGLFEAEARIGLQARELRQRIEVTR